MSNASREVWSTLYRKAVSIPIFQSALNLFMNIILFGYKLGFTNIKNTHFNNRNAERVGTLTAILTFK